MSNLRAFVLGILAAYLVPLLVYILLCFIVWIYEKIESSPQFCNCFKRLDERGEEKRHISEDELIRFRNRCPDNVRIYRKKRIVLIINTKRSYLFQLLVMEKKEAKDKK